MELTSATLLEHHPGWPCRGVTEPSTSMAPSQLVPMVQGDVWLNAAVERGADAYVIGLDSVPQTLHAHVRSHSLVAYVGGRSNVAWTVGGRKLYRRMMDGDIITKGLGMAGDWSWDGTTTTIQVFLSPTLLQTTAAEIYGPQPGLWRLRDSIDVRDDRLLDDMRTLASEAVSTEPGASVVMATLVKQIAVRALRRHADLLPMSDPRLQLFDVELSRRLVSYISMHLEHNLAASDLARAHNMDPERFTRIFRNTFKQSPQEFVRAVRLRRACELMEDSTRSLADVAYLTGFTDQSHLTRVFKQQFGLPPGAWRRKREDALQ